MSAAQAAIVVTLLVGAATLLIVGVMAAISVFTTRRSISQIARATESLAAGNGASVDLAKMERKDELARWSALWWCSRTIRRTWTSCAPNRKPTQLHRGGTPGQGRGRRRSRPRAGPGGLKPGRGPGKARPGDLTFRVSAEFPGEYKKLRDDFNAAITQLEGALRRISDSTAGIQTGSKEISHAADDLSRRTEQQAAALEQTAAALDEITATVRRTADGANHAREVVSNAKADATKSGEIVRGAVAAMNQIETSAKQISQIIGVIDEIAFQTNLLALNAGVEAARAGDAGRGFPPWSPPKCGPWPSAPPRPPRRSRS